jgi:hypothetical protein
MEYKNGLRHFEYHTSPGKTLAEIFKETIRLAATVDDSSDWNEDQIRILKSINHYGVLTTVASVLSREYLQTPIYDKLGEVAQIKSGTFNYTLANGSTLELVAVTPWGDIDNFTPDECKCLGNRKSSL